MFERDVTPTLEMAAGVIRIPPGHEQQKLSSHQGEEIYFTLAGRGRFILGDDEVDIESGTAVYVSPWKNHRAINAGEEDLVLYFVGSPSGFGEVGEYRKAVADWKKLR